MARTAPPATPSPSRGAVPRSQAQRSPLARVVDGAWWFFTSVRVALWLIGATGLWVLIATLAQSTFPTWVAAQVPALTDLMRQWSSWEVWQSPPFLLTLGLLAISLILGGMVNRWGGIAQRVWHPNVRTSPGFFRAVKQHAEFTAPSPEAATAAFVHVLGGKRYRRLAHTEPKDGSIHLYADKYHYSPLATFPFHLGLVTILVGAVVMASFGWREIGFLVPDGGSRAVGHGTGLTVTNLGFTDDYYDDGRARDYYSDLVIRDAAGNVATQGRLRVNDPLAVGAVSFHQATYGNAAKLRVTDSAGNLVFEEGVPLLPPRREVAAQFTDSGGGVRSIGVQELKEAGVIVRIVGSGGPTDESIRTGQLRIAVFDNRAVRQTAGPIGTGLLDPGGSTVVGGLTFTFLRELRFTGLQVTYAPGLPLIYLASGTIFFALLVTFYLPHRRIRALVTRQPDGTARMLLGAQVKLDLFGAQEFVKIAAQVREVLSSEYRVTSEVQGTRGMDAVPVVGD